MSDTGSAYIAFCKAKRHEVNEAKFGDKGKILRALWNKMSDSEKAIYTKEPVLRRSSRLRNKQLGLNFWGNKIKP